MMWGYQVRRTTLRDAPFVCARCGVDRVGSEIEPQRWFTMLGRRVIPLATLERIIECQTCGHQADTGALQIPTSDQLADMLVEATRHSVVSVVRACTGLTDDVSPGVLATAVTTMQDADKTYDERRVLNDLGSLPTDQTATHLAGLVAELTPHGKQGFLRRLGEIATVDGPMNGFARQAVLDIGLALGMAAPHINGVLAVATLQYESA